MNLASRFTLNSKTLIVPGGMGVRPIGQEYWELLYGELVTSRGWLLLFAGKITSHWLASGANCFRRAKRNTRHFVAALFLALITQAFKAAVRMPEGRRVRSRPAEIPTVMSLPGS